MTVTSREKEKIYACNLFFYHSMSISAISKKLERSRSTIRKWLTEKGYISQKPYKTEMLPEQGALLAELAERGITTVNQLKIAFAGLDLEEQLITTAPKDWGIVLYSAAVKRSALVRQRMAYIPIEQEKAE